MRAMILAAGFGTRLYPVTVKIPKALVKVSGVPLLEITIKKLIQSGIHDIIVNVHHHCDQIINFLDSNNRYNIHLEISKEEVILGTGGGLKKASHFFEEDSFLIHNVDVISNLNLRKVIKTHKSSDALVTLVVQKRKTQRYLVFDSDNQLCGRSGPESKNLNVIRNPHGDSQLLAFNGIHVVSAKLLPLISEQGNFSIIDVYLRLASMGYKIYAYDIGDTIWFDLGKLEALIEAERAINSGEISV